MQSEKKNITLKSARGAILISQEAIMTTSGIALVAELNDNQRSKQQVNKIHIEEDEKGCLTTQKGNGKS